MEYSPKLPSNQPTQLSHTPPKNNIQNTPPNNLNIHSNNLQITSNQTIKKHQLKNPFQKIIQLYPSQQPPKFNHQKITPQTYSNSHKPFYQQSIQLKIQKRSSLIKEYLNKKFKYMETIENPPNKHSNHLKIQVNVQPQLQSILRQAEEYINRKPSYSQRDMYRQRFLQKKMMLSKNSSQNVKVNNGLRKNVESYLKKVNDRQNSMMQYQCIKSEQSSLYQKRKRSYLTALTALSKQ